MELRRELMPPRVAPEYFAAVTRIVERTYALMEQGQPFAEDHAVLCELTGQHVSEDRLHHTFGSEAPEEFAVSIVRGKAASVPDVTRAELAELVRRVWRQDADSSYYLELFGRNVSNPRGANAIVVPPAGLREATAEEIVAWVLAYRPIAL